jgi:O-antigen ligase
MWMAVHAFLQHHRGYGFANQKAIWRVRHWEWSADHELADGESPPGVWQARAFGTFEDPNDLCLIFITCIPLLYAEFRSASTPMLKGLALVGLSLVGYGVWLTNSRGGYLGVFAMVSAFVIGRLKGFRRWAVLAFSIFFLTLFAPSRFASGLVGQQDRAILWGDGIAMFKANPFFGVGVSMFQTYQDEHKVAHNTYVHVLAETGIIGYIPFFMMIYFTFVHLRRTMNMRPLLDKTDNIQLAGLFSAAVGYFTSLYFLTRQETHLPYIMLGLMCVKSIGACRTPELSSRVFTQTGKEYLIATIWGFASIIFMWVTIRIVNSLGT